MITTLIESPSSWPMATSSTSGSAGEGVGVRRGCSSGCGGCGCCAAAFFCASGFASSFLRSSSSRLRSSGVLRSSAFFWASVFSFSLAFSGALSAGFSWPSSWNASCGEKSTMWKHNEKTTPHARPVPTRSLSARGGSMGERQGAGAPGPAGALPPEVGWFAAATPGRPTRLTVMLSGRSRSQSSCRSGARSTRPWPSAMAR